ncbi:MAG: DNA-3-methyladenine glycosylase I [Bacilli bacterium]|nr:DNA-3-methyladenine glycosylase I [Bacilli bacterium]
MKRCDWCYVDNLYMQYHDEEWGKPVFNDRRLFEMLILEMFQAGLSWHTILKKRKNFQDAFDNFDYVRVSQYDEEKINELMNNQGIIRNRLKILAAINNAKQYMKIQEEYGSFADYLWSYVNHHPIINHYQSLKEIPATSNLSDKIAKDLKNKGFKFLGSTIIYSYLQAVGVVDDHIDDCFCKNKDKGENTRKYE